jgi:two-component system response regulator VanR
VRVLIVEDEVFLAEAICAELQNEAMAVDIVGDGDTALEQLALNDYDVVVLDRDIPGTHGDDVCRALSASEREVGVLMLTAAARCRDKVEGLRLGADDYLAKPFEFDELIARIRSVGRRKAPVRPPVFERAGVRLDPFLHEATRNGRPLRLTKKEFAILQVLLEAGGGVLSAERLLEKAWDDNVDPFTHTAKVTISNLRKKLGEPWVIHTVAGVGYCLRESL